MQFALGSDIIICLDDFTPPGANSARIRLSVERTLAWAERCKQEYERQCRLWLMDKDERPLILAVIQGHDDWGARTYCAQGLQHIGFDGFCLGGVKMTPQGRLDLEWAAKNAALTPDDMPRYAMGFGKPDEIVKLYQLGYEIFDCVLPTRDARHGRLCIYPENERELYQFLDIGKSRYQFDDGPLDTRCQCHTCQSVSRAYLHHLFKLREAAFSRLATIHNLHFFTSLTRSLAT